MAGIILIILGAVLIVHTLAASRKSIAFTSELNDFKSTSAKYEATVLDITGDGGRSSEPKAVIIQIRIEEQKRTIVHRCTEKFYRNYSRGDRISVYFREEMPADRAIIDGDNRYEHFLQILNKFRIPSIAAGAVISVAGTVLLFASAL